MPWRWWSRRAWGSACDPQATASAGASDPAARIARVWHGRAPHAKAAGEELRRSRNLPRDAEFLIDPEPTVMNYELRVNAIPWGK